jgi:hypothetical protein
MVWLTTHPKKIGKTTQLKFNAKTFLEKHLLHVPKTVNFIEFTQPI